MSLEKRICFTTRNRTLLAVALAGVLCAKAFAGGEKPPAPAMRIPYKDLGFPGYAPALMRVGTYSMSTLHMLDSTHVLFTFSLRSLVPRLPGDDERDTDRLVAAEILELPSGNVLARTQWRLHDHGRYLWRAGHGLFILRTADELSAFAPLRGLEAGHPFERIAIPHRPGIPALVTNSPDGAILTVQVQEPGQADDTESDGFTPKKHHAIIEFYRVSGPSAPDGAVELKSAGPVVGAPGFLHLPVDGDGYLWAEDQRRGSWAVSFNEFGGKQEKVATIHTSCAPRLTLLSRGEFLAETCRGLDQTPVLAAYGFDGHENWEEPVGNNLQPPTIVTAPEAGRFAMSRLTANGAGSGVASISPDNPMVQELRVYQTESGDMLLRLQCANPIRTSENFDLSPDGSTLAVLGHEGIEIFKLRGLTDRDRKDLADVQTMTPPASEAPVVLARIVQPVGGDRRLLKDEDPRTAAADSGAVAGGAGAPGAAGVAGTAVDSGDAGPVAPANGATIARAPAGAAPSAVPAAAADQQGSSSAVARGPVAPVQNAALPVGEPGADVPAGPRKPPTLLHPGESAEYKGQSSETQAPQPQ